MAAPHKRKKSDSSDLSHFFFFKSKYKTLEARKNSRNYLEHIAAVIEVDMEAYFVDQAQVVCLDSVPFYTHAYEVVVVAVFDNYLELPFQLVLVLLVRSVDAWVASQPDRLSAADYFDSNCLAVLDLMFASDYSMDVAALEGSAGLQ